MLGPQYRLPSGEDEDIIKKIIDAKLTDIKQHRREQNEYYVTDLVRCSLKREYELKYPEITFSSALVGRLLLGDIVHKGMEALLKQLYGDRVRIESEGLEKEITLSIGNKIYKLSGRIDAIIDNKVGVEIKETITKGSLPFDHHVEQCMIYNYLYGLDYTILLYISPDGIYQFIIEKRMSENEIVERITEPKAPRYTWECQYCPFNSICSVYKFLINNKQR